MRSSFPDPDGWPRPLRAPQHAAAPLALSVHTRQQAHRALRLFVAGGTWAAGLCLVIGVIVLVVSTASPSRLDPTAATSSARGKTVRGDGPAARSLRVIGAFAGYGDRSTRSFRIDDTRPWLLRWSYTCPARLHAGLLVVEVANPGAVGATVSRSGAGGGGVTSINPDGPSHHLVVISTCSWTLKVTQTR
jgi:hypothetical protein